MSGKRQYQNWPSKNEFECKGRLIHGPDRAYFWLSAVLLVGVGLAFIIFVTPEIFKGDTVSPGWNVALIPVFLVVWIFTIVMHLTVSYMDPGIIPRQPAPKSSTNADPYLRAAHAPPQTKNINVRGLVLSVKWCPTCNLHRPPRAIHCGICDNCVLRFDHHCPYLGNCVGLRNYRFFLLFIFGTLVTSVFVLVHSLILIITRCVSLGIVNAFDAGPVGFVFAWITGVIALLATLLVGTLVGFTSYLVTKGRTTNENIKQVYVGINPFDEGFFRNWFNTCFPPAYPTAIHPRKYVREVV